MKTDREKLIELIFSGNREYLSKTSFAEISYRKQQEYLADYLIEHGMTIPVRCKDCVYNKNGSCNNSEEHDPFYNGEFYCADGEMEEK